VKLAFLAADDPLYLPSFFETVLAECSAETAWVYSVPPLYKGQSPAQAAWRYYRTFGATAVWGLVRRLAATKLRRNSIERVCNRHAVRHGVIRDVNAADFVSQVDEQGIDVLVSVSCPQIFKEPLLAAPRTGCLNVHGALLPQYRGIMPSFWMLANGERQAGVTIYFMNERIDAGDLVGQRAFEILPTETLDAFLRRSKRLAAELLVEVLRSLRQGTLQPTRMDMAGGSYYSWPNEAAVRSFRAAGRSLW
jgi:methionyl-tRNA formyltransferase